MAKDYVAYGQRDFFSWKTYVWSDSGESPMFAWIVSR